VDVTRIVTLLTAAVISIGAIISFWGAGLIQKTLNRTQTTEELCLGAMFRLYSGKYDSNKKELTLILENQRTIDLKLENLYLFYPNKLMKTFSLNEVLEGNMLKSVVVSDVDDGFETGTIKTNCPDVSLDFTYSDVT
jgi:hypothetical protein